jgi:iron complex transport system substrate-binding protein
MKTIILIALMMLHLHAKTITDMLDRTTTIPDTPKRVYAPSPYGSYALYAMDPSLLVGWIFNIREKFYPYLNKRMKTLPVVGRVFGAGQSANLEILLAQHPDLILMWSHRNEFTQREEQKVKILNTPYVYALDENLLDYVKVFRFLGEALNLQARGEKLAAYTQTTFDEVNKVVSSVPKAKRPKVYYAEGLDGLSTECDDSIHVEILKIAGDVNMHRCHTSSHKGFEKLSMETLLEYNPDVIFVQDEMFYKSIYDLKLWKNIKAVQDKQVFLIPKAPFNWFDRPPSFMRILGLKWAVYNLYKSKYLINMQQETKDFYKLFLNVDLTQKQVEILLNEGDKR